MSALGLFSLQGPLEVWWEVWRCPPAWGGFKRRVHGVLAGWIISSFFFSLVGLGTQLPLWIVAMALHAVVVPLINGSNQAIWQSKVAPDLQGRVFSARTLIAWMTNPISPLIAGTLADYVLEPAMRVQGGLGGLLAGLAGYFVSAIRNAEHILQDHDALPAVESA